MTHLHISFIIYREKSKVWHSMWILRWNVKQYFLWKIIKAYFKILSAAATNGTITVITFWANSTDDKLMTVFLFYPENRFWHFMQRCLLRRQFIWNVKACFLEKIRKNISKCHLLKFLPSILTIILPCDLCSSFTLSVRTFICLSWKITSTLKASCKIGAKYLFLLFIFISDIYVFSFGGKKGRWFTWKVKKKTKKNKLIFSE